MHPPNSETWTGAIEYHEDGEGIRRIPACGQTASGGSSANIQVALSAPDRAIRRAYVVEGVNLEGPVVAEATCGETEEEREPEDDDGCEAGDVPGADPSSAGDVPRTGPNSSLAEAIVEDVKEQVGIDRRE